MESRTTQSSVFRRFLHSRLFLVIVCILIAILVYGNVRSLYQSYAIKQEIGSMQQELQNLQHKRIQSMDILRYVMSNDFVEEKARTELNMKKPGEHVVIIQDADTGTVSSSTPNHSSGQTASNPLKWWYYFTHRTL